MLYNEIFNNYIFESLDHYGLRPKKEAELKKYIGFIIYLRQILTEAVAMLEIKGAPDSLDVHMLELFRYCNGHAGIYKHDKYGLVCFPGSFAGDPDAYGRGLKYVGALLNGEPIEGTIGEDVIVIPNNFSYSADLPIMYNFAKRLNEVDTSLDLNVFYSRLAPIVKVSNGKVKEAVDVALNNILVGELKSVMASDLESELDGFKSIDILNITDVKDVDKLQYLSKYHDDLLRRLYTLGGHAMAGTQKMAQQSAYEVGQNDTISMIYPLERLTALKEGLEKVNNLFGTSLTADFSKAWNVEEEKIETSIATDNEIQKGGVDAEKPKEEEDNDDENA